MHPTLRITTALAAALLAGCASFSEDGGFAPVQQAARRHLGQDLQWARTSAEQERIATRVDGLLARPLDMDAAVQLALLNNPGLQARFFTLGITEAEVVQAGRLPNPGLSLGRLRRGDETEIERGLHLDLARLLALPLVARLEERRMARLQLATAQQVVALAADTRRAWVQAVAAEEGVRYMRQVREAADAGAELAGRMRRAGNFSPLQQMREEGFLADATLGLARAQQHQQATRERLTRLLGLWGAQAQYRLPERLPDLPAAPREQPDIERRAVAQRLDVQAVRLAAEQTARNLGLTRTTRLVNVLELGAVRNSANDAPTQRGWELRLELPLFDFGTARVARAEAVYGQALAQAAETAVNARSEVRQAYGHYRAAWDIAHHQRTEVVPLRQRIAEQNLLRYNGMLIGVFELLADARTQVAAVQGAIEALRDFWLAQADLDMALLGPPTLPTPFGAASAPATSPTGDAH